MPCFLTKATKSAGVKRDRADLAKRGLSLRKLAAVTSMLVKLARPPPEMRIFSATLSLWSINSTCKPRWAATPAQNRPAAPAPTITTSKLCMGGSVRSARSVERALAGVTVNFGELIYHVPPIMA